MLNRSVLGASVLVLSFVSGCSDGTNGDVTGPDNAAGRSNTGGKGGKPATDDVDDIAGGMGGTGGCAPGGGSGGGCALPPDLGRLSSLMRRATSCDDLSEQLRSELLAQIQAQIDGQNMGGSGGGGSFPVPGSGGGWGGPGGSWGTGGQASGGSASSSGGSSASAGSGSGGPVFTGTNTQIPNVDEPDFVKTDGKHLYVLQAGRLRVATAHPAASLAELTSTPIEGFAREMFLAEGATEDEQRVVIYSEVEGAAVLGEAGIAALPQDYAPFIKVTVLAFAEGALSTETEYYFEGSYISARRTANRVRQVLSLWRSYPAGLRTWATDADNRKAELLVLEQLGEENRSVADLTSAELDVLFKKAVAEVIASENQAALQAIRGEDWVPRAFIRKGTKLVPANIACEDVYIPEAGTLDSTITYVPEFDVDQPASLPRGAALLGGSQTLYQNQSELILASPPNYSHDDDGGVRTYLHVFDVDQDEPLAYRASGVVEGSVAGQFALDEKGGAFRAVTSIWDETGPSSRLFSLAAEGTDLNVVGSTEAIAPGETLRAVRFVGDTAYLVTFRNIDPLFVIDLTDPEQPTQLAELEIPGFSQYMHPIGDTHLLTIGQTGDFGADVMLRLFDVTDKTAPVALFSHEFSDWGSSDAQVDHRAFAYFGDRGLLAIPFSAYTYDWQTSAVTAFNKLALIKVDTGSGFDELGSIDGSGLRDSLQDAGSCSWSSEYDARFERGTFIDSTLYAIARHGIVAANVDTPETIIATLPLPTPCNQGGSGGSGIGGAPGGGSGSGPTTGGVWTGGNGPAPTTGGAPSGGSGGLGGTGGSAAGSGGGGN